MDNVKMIKLIEKNPAPIKHRLKITLLAFVQLIECFIVIMSLGYILPKLHLALLFKYCTIKEK